MDNKMKDIGNLCTDCHRDTSFGSGLFVNRIPSMTEDEDGYLCRECRMFDCDRCKRKIAVDEDILIVDTSERVHEECLKDNEELDREEWLVQ